MEQGTIKIEENNSGHFNVSAKLYNGDIWLTKHQIADLFEVFVSAVSAKLKSLFKNGLLDENEVIRNCEVVRRNSFSYSIGKTYVDLYNMEAILMLSFHLKSKKTEVFRKWVQTHVRRNIENKEIPLIVASMAAYKLNELN